MGWVNKDSSIVRKYSKGDKIPEKEEGKLKTAPGKITSKEKKAALSGDKKDKSSKVKDVVKKGAIGVAAIGAPTTMAAVSVMPIVKYWKEHGMDATIEKYGKRNLAKAAARLKVRETKPTKKYKEGDKTESDKSKLETIKEYGMDALKAGPSLPAMATRAFMKFYRDNPEKFKKSSKGPRPPIMKKPKSK